MQCIQERQSSTFCAIVIISNIYIPRCIAALFTRLVDTRHPISLSDLAVFGWLIKERSSARKLRQFHLEGSGSDLICCLTPHDQTFEAIKHWIWRTWNGTGTLTNADEKGARTHLPVGLRAMHQTSVHEAYGTRSPHTNLG